MNLYEIPQNVVGEDFAFFRKSYEDFKSGVLDELAFKTIRVPFGIYEQREPNTYMVRIKTNGGAITPTQLQEVAKLANRYANNELHITTRGGIQLHYTKLDELCEIVEALHSIGLTGRGGGGNTVRNIVCDPFSGISKDDIFDVLPYVNALTSKILSLKDSYNLPRKYKIAFSSSDTDRAVATITDVGFVATIKDGVKGFKVYIAGGMGAKSRLGHKFLDFIKDDEIFLVSQSLKEVFDEHGNRKNKHAARVRFLAESLGVEKLHELIIEKMEANRQKGNWRLEIKDITPLHVEAQNEAQFSSIEQEKWWSRFVFEQSQKGLYCAKVPLELGDIDANGAVELAKKLGVFQEDSIRFASNQNLYLRNLTKAQLLELYPLILAISPQSAKATIIGDMVACTGAATCQLGITRPRGAVEQIEKYLATKGLNLDSIQGFKIHLSGCPNSCGNHATADLGFFGKVARFNSQPYPAYNVLVGATIKVGQTAFAKKVAEVSAWALPKFVYEVLSEYIVSKKSTFVEFLQNGGEEKVIELAKQNAAVPDFKDDKNPYFDYTSSEIFSLKGRGAGECSAGMYDLIEADKKNLTEALNSDDMEEIRLLACRMLLVTRGEDAREEEGVKKAFREKFIDSGLIEIKHLNALHVEDLQSVKELANAVIELYGTMDHTLKFAKEKDIKVEPKSENLLKDFRGVACPMNFVKTKMELSRLESGAVLDILLDGGAPIENVPASVKSEGHTIKEIKQEGEHWKVTIVKK